MNPYMASRTIGSVRILRGSCVTRLTSAPASSSRRATSMEVGFGFLLGPTRVLAHAHARGGHQRSDARSVRQIHQRFVLEKQFHGGHVTGVRSAQQRCRTGRQCVVLAARQPYERRAPLFQLTVRVRAALEQELGELQTRHRRFCPSPLCDACGGG